MNAVPCAHRHSFILLFLLVVLSSAGCSLFSGPRHHEEVRSPETAVAKKPLPLPQRIVHRLEFNDPADGSRMTPKDRSDIKPANSAPETVTMDEVGLDLQPKALANTVVRNLLGTRYALISMTVTDAGHRMSQGCCTSSPSKTRLTFYSYSNNLTVDAEMKGDTVANVQRLEGYLPMEGGEEIQEAIALARKDTRIGGALPGLEGHAILMQPGDGIFWNDPGYGHRVFWVTFSQGRTGNPQYWAVVDLSEQKVLKAGKEEAHP